MIYINNLTNNAFQQFSLTGIPGVQINCLLRYMPRIQRWLLDLTYNTIEIRGICVATSPNFLRQWRNELPFGMACVRSDGLDPYDVDDFVNAVANLYLLDANDLAQQEADLFT